MAHSWRDPGSSAQYAALCAKSLVQNGVSVVDWMIVCSKRSAASLPATPHFGGRMSGRLEPCEKLDDPAGCDVKTQTPGQSPGYVFLRQARRFECAENSLILIASDAFPCTKLAERLACLSPSLDPLAALFQTTMTAIHPSTSMPREIAGAALAAGEKAPSSTWSWLQRAWTSQELQSG